MPKPELKREVMTQSWFLYKWGKYVETKYGVVDTQFIWDVDALQAQARQAALKNACGIYCDQCAQGNNPIKEQGYWIHPGEEPLMICGANPIQKLMAEDEEAKRAEA